MYIPNLASWCIAIIGLITLPSTDAFAIDIHGLRQRALDHPSAKDRITLFHGTGLDYEDADAIAQSGLDLKRENAANSGDFHSLPFKGGYLTDSIYAAAQFSCYPWNFKGTEADVKKKKVYVIEFAWDGDEDVYEFTGKTDEWRKASPKKFVESNISVPFKQLPNHNEIQKHTMITGPMEAATGADKNYTPIFWQYTILAHREKGFQYSDKLKPKVLHEALCGNIPRGADLDEDLYKKGQATDNDFLKTLDTIKADV